MNLVSIFHLKWKIKDPPLVESSAGNRLLNLGCGSTTHADWTNIDFSLLAALNQHPILTRFLHRLGILSEERFKRINQISGNIVVWDLREGIPYPDESFTGVYHSHLLEHLPRDEAPMFLRENLRVLEPGGVLRVVVPDLQVLAGRYLESLEAVEDAAKGSDSNHYNDYNHEAAIEDLLEQMVREVPAGTQRQRPLVRWIEEIVRGDAAAAGEVHQWMYDEHSLRRVLEDVGFVNVERTRHDVSRIPDWKEFLLDSAGSGGPRIDDSLYMEAERPPG